MGEFLDIHRVSGLLCLLGLRESLLMTPSSFSVPLVLLLGGVIFA